MSFLLDILLLGFLVLTVVMYAKRSIFSALSGVIAVAVAAAVAVLLTGPLSAPLSSYVVTPLVEKSAAGTLADMFSAPHLATGRETVASLPLGDLVTEQPEAYRQLLDYYCVEPETVQAAWAAEPTPTAVLAAITATYADTLSRGAVLLLITVAVSLLLRLIAQRIEQNFPPVRRYHGFKRAIPALLGVAGGVIWSWVAATVICWVVPVTAGQLLFLTPQVLQQTDWYRLLSWSNPLQMLFDLLG